NACSSSSPPWKSHGRSTQSCSETRPQKYGVERALFGGGGLLIFGLQVIVGPYSRPSQRQHPERDPYPGRARLRLALHVGRTAAGREGVDVLQRDSQHLVLVVGDLGVGRVR